MSFTCLFQRYYMDDSKLRRLGWSQQVKWEDGLKVNTQLPSKRNKMTARQTSSYLQITADWYAANRQHWVIFTR